MYKIVSLIFFLKIAAVFTDYPDFIPKCNFADDGCFEKTAKLIFKNYYGGLPELNITPFDPLRVKSLVLPRNPSSPVNIEFKFTDLDVIGLKTSQLIRFKSLVAGERNYIEVKVPTLILKGNYVVDGNVLILPIKGNGKETITCTNIVLTYSFDVKTVDANGKTFAEIEHVKLELKPERVQYNFENLFNGDKALGDNMNKFLNENWLDIFNELKGSVAKGLSLVIKDIINNVHRAFPYDFLYHKPN